MINKNGEEKFLKVLNKDLTSWPIINNSSTPQNNLTIIEKLVALRNLGFKPLIDVHVGLNPKNPKYSILKVIYY